MNNNIKKIPVIVFLENLFPIKTSTALSFELISETIIVVLNN
jgi:hypothetical protein